MAITASHVGLFFSFLCLPFLVHSTTNKDDAKTIKGMFVFGSSLVDNGNNNFLNGTTAKADYPPYGIDAEEATGRFTNGKNVIDLLGEQLNLPASIPPFLNPSTKGPRIVNGINFASGGSGILDSTGIRFVKRVISLNQQIKDFEKTLPELEAQLGQRRDEFLSNYLFVVGSGGNDYTFDYLVKGDASSAFGRSFAANLTLTLSHQLKKLYEIGGRKFVVMSVYPIGCYPMVRNVLKTGRRCVLFANKAAEYYNSELKKLVDDLKHQLPGSDLIYVDCYKIIDDILQAPHSTSGFKKTKDTCCQVKPIGGLCKENGKVCSNRNTYVFFDGIHPTEAVNVQIATKAFSSDDPAEVYPISISRLAGVAV